MAHHALTRAVTPARRRAARRIVRRCRPHLPFLTYTLITLAVMVWMIDTMCRARG